MAPVLESTLIAPSIPMMMPELDAPVEEQAIEGHREVVQWHRKAYHVGFGLTLALGYWFSNLNPFWACIVVGLAVLPSVVVDIARHFIPSLNKRVLEDFRSLMRDYEVTGLSSGSWFSLGGWLAIALLPKWIAVLAILHLAVGDPIASLIGVRYGRTKLPGGRSLEGSTACFVAAALIGLLVAVTAPGLSMVARVLLVFVGGLTAAFAEWLPLPWLEDNFRVPVVSGGLLFAFMTGFGII